MDDLDSIREWLKYVPDRLLAAESGRRNSSRRRNYHGGRPKAKLQCSACELEMGAREPRRRSAICRRGRSLSEELPAPSAYDDEQTIAFFCSVSPSLVCARSSDSQSRANPGFLSYRRVCLRRALECRFNGAHGQLASSPRHNPVYDVMERSHPGYTWTDSVLLLSALRSVRALGRGIPSATAPMLRPGRSRDHHWRQTAVLSCRV